MTLTHIIVLAAVALLIGMVRSSAWRGWVLMGVCVLAIYWMQPSTPVRHLDFWLPTASLLLVILTWIATRPPMPIQTRADFLAGGLAVLIVLGLGLMRYVEPLCCLTPTKPPEVLVIGLAIGLATTTVLGTARFFPNRAHLAIPLAVLILMVFLFLKTNPLGEVASAWLRSASGQQVSLASALDLRWLGFSYLAFRLLHTLRDHAAGKLPALSLRDYLTYAFFFPAYTAGPIDRVQRFSGDLAKPFTLTAAVLVQGGQRLALGVFKKFVLADGLALFALNEVNAQQTASTGWLWLLLYAYSFRIYFDFSGYTDIAIGLGNLAGIRLPENFDRPYLKPNLTSFWNSWHITLAQWFRAYFFNPFTRSLRSQPAISVTTVVLAGQVATMVLIGLWHGVTWNFVAWGLWHGLGLFVHNRW